MNAKPAIVELLYDSIETGPPGGWPLGPQEILEVGKFIVLWNLIEKQIDELFAFVTKLNSSAVNTIMRNPHLPSRADIFIEGFKSYINDQELCKSAELCAKKIKALSNFRNEIAHGRWKGVRISIEDGGRTLRPMVPMSSKQNGGSKLITMGDLMKNFEEIRRLSYRIADLTWRCCHHRGVPHYSLPSPYHDKF
jgi:hypothetical protein